MLIRNSSWLSADVQEHCLNLVTNFSERFLDSITNENWIKHLFSVEDDTLPDGLLAKITEQLMKLSYDGWTWTQIQQSMGWKLVAKWKKRI